MIQDSLAKFIALFLAVILMIFVPMIFFAQQSDSAIQTVVYNDTVSFVEGMREQGKLTQEMYNLFIRDLDTTGLLYEVEIEVAHSTVLPIFDEDGNVKGTKEITEMSYSDEILKKVFTGIETKMENGEIQTEDGVYEFSKGDRITVTVTSRENTTSTSLYNSIVGTNLNGKIYAVYGGAVRDENH